MEVAMTLNDYILNPMGKSNAVLSAISRESQRTSFKVKFDNVLLREKGNIDYRCYKDDQNNTYWLHVKVPSEHVKKFYYDVVMKFFTDAEHGTDNDLMKWRVQFYSNDPAFVFTYAYAFNQKGLFIRELTSKMSKTALTTPSKEKNPGEMIGYCKIIYFAYLVMENRNLNKINVFNANATTLDPKSFLKTIADADMKVEDRQNQKVSYAKKRTVSGDELAAMQRAAGGKLDLTDSNLYVRTTRKINKIQNVNTTQKIGKVGKISRKK